jgi:hypothetical protein
VPGVADDRPATHRDYVHKTIIDLTYRQIWLTVEQTRASPLLGIDHFFAYESHVPNQSRVVSSLLELSAVVPAGQRQRHTEPIPIGSRPSNRNQRHGYPPTIDHRIGCERRAARPTPDHRPSTIGMGVAIAAPRRGPLAALGRPPEGFRPSSPITEKTLPFERTHRWLSAAADTQRLTDQHGDAAFLEHETSQGLIHYTIHNIRCRYSLSFLPFFCQGGNYNGSRLHRCISNFRKCEDVSDESDYPAMNKILAGDRDESRQWF